MLKIRQFKMAYRTLVLPFLLFVSLSSAQAAGITAPKMAWQGGALVAICDGPVGTCYTVELPKTIGKVEGIYPAPIVKNARASWVARTTYELHVCAVVANSSNVSCAKISPGLDEALDPFPSEYADLRMMYSPSGNTRIAVVGRGTAAGNGSLITTEKVFNRSYARAVAILQGVIDTLSLINVPLTSRTNLYDPGKRGDPPEAGCEWNGDGWMCAGPRPYDHCAAVAESRWSCSAAGELPAPELEADPV